MEIYRVPEPDLELGRMHVDVYRVGRKGQIQDIGGISAMKKHVFIRTPHGMTQCRVSYRAPVNEEILKIALAARDGGHPEPALDRGLRTRFVNGQMLRGEIVATQTL